MKQTKTNRQNGNGNGTNGTANVCTRQRDPKQIVMICIKAYRTAAGIKANKVRIMEKYGLDQKGYMSVIRDAKDVIKDNIKESAKSLKNNVLGYSNILKVAYTEIATSKEYSLIANYAAEQGKMNVTEFVQTWYSFVDRNGNILCKKDYTDGKNVYTYLVAKDNFTGAFALSVVRNCLDNFARLAVNKAAKVAKSEYTWINKYDNETLFAAYHGKEENGRLVKGEKFVANGIRIEDLQPLTEYNNK